MTVRAGTSVPTELVKIAFGKCDTTSSHGSAVFVIAIELDVPRTQVGRILGVPGEIL